MRVSPFNPSASASLATSAEGDSKLSASSSIRVAMDGVISTTNDLIVAGDEESDFMIRWVVCFGVSVGSAARHFAVRAAAIGCKSPSVPTFGAAAHPSWLVRVPMGGFFR